MKITLFHHLNPMTIRPYISDDKDALMNLFRLNTPDFFSPSEEAEFAHFLDQPVEHYYVVELNSLIVGCGGFAFDDPHTGVICWDMIHPDYHGKGIGKALLQYRIDEIRKFHDIHYIVVRTSQLVYRFYEKSGFELKQVVKDYWAKGYDLYRMEMKTHPLTPSL